MKFVFVSIITATIMSLIFIVTILVVANQESILIKGLLAFLGVFIIALLAGVGVGILSKSNENGKKDEIGGDKK